jgi:glycosyl hydrolase family 113
MEYAVPRLRLVIAGFVIAAIALPFANAVIGTVREQNGAVEQRGVVLPTWQIHGYEGPATAQATSDIAGLGATWIQLTPTWKMATATSSRIDVAWSITDADVLAAIDLAHSKGLKILLKPHVDPQDGTSRWQINPSNRAAWFGSYQSMMTHYATIAQQEGVDEFSVGCELATMSGSADRSTWLTVINAIKAAYSGPLVYAAKADEYSNVSFWDQLNFVGIDAYFPLSTKPTTDISALEAAWIPIRDQMSAFAVGVGRRILFTEAGYPSLVGAAVEPWNNQYSSTPSQQEQAAAYEALLATFSGQPWWVGAFWWSWWTDNGVFAPLDLAIGGKLAASVVRNWWAPSPSSGNRQDLWIGCVRGRGSLPSSPVGQEGRAALCQDPMIGQDEKR